MIIEKIADNSPCDTCKYSTAEDYFGNRQCKRAEVLHTCPEGESYTSLMDCDSALRQFRKDGDKCVFFKRGVWKLLLSILTEI